jgi:Tfp pilus assembly protein PilF
VTLALRDNLELMLQRGQDSPLLRFSLGNECLKGGDHLAAINHLRQAVEQNPGYSAAWKLLGQAYASSGSTERAADVYRRGIEAAEAAGDVQAAREMKVFLRRIERKEPGGQ